MDEQLDNKRPLKCRFEKDGWNIVARFKMIENHVEICVEKLSVRYEYAFDTDQISDINLTREELYNVISRAAKYNDDLVELSDIKELQESCELCIKLYDCLKRSATTIVITLNKLNKE